MSDIYPCTFDLVFTVRVGVPYGIGGSCTDEITFLVLWHDRWIASPRIKSTTRAHILSVERSGLQHKKKDLASRLHVCKCKNKQNFLRFIVLSPKKGLRHLIACLSTYIGHCK